MVSRNFYNRLVFISDDCPSKRLLASESHILFFFHFSIGISNYCIIKIVLFLDLCLFESFVVYGEILEAKRGNMPGFFKLILNESESANKIILNIINASVNCLAIDLMVFVVFIETLF